VRHRPYSTVFAKPHILGNWHGTCTKTGMSKSNTIAHHQDTQEIRRTDWIPFLAEFTRENRGAHARLDVIGPDTETGYQVETENRPFDGVSADIKDQESIVWIAFGSTAEDHLTHGVHNARVLRVLSPTESRGAVFAVESTDGRKTILELTHTASYSLPPAEPR
jgi:hypothetical protein